MIACLLLLIGIYSCRACASTTTAAVASRTVLAAPCLLQEISKARRRLQRRLYNFLRMVARGAVATMLIFVVAVAVTVTVQQLRRGGRVLRLSADRCGEGEEVPGDGRRGVECSEPKQAPEVRR